MDENIKNKLLEEVTRKEMFNVLAAIHYEKAPGNYGCLSFFFKVVWNVVGDDFVRAMNFFS